MIDMLWPEQHFFLYFFPFAVAYLAICFFTGYPLLYVFSKEKSFTTDLATPVGFAATLCIFSVSGFYGGLLWIIINVVTTISLVYRNVLHFPMAILSLKKIFSTFITIVILLLFAYVYLWPTIHLSSRNNSDQALFEAGSDGSTQLMLLAQEIKTPGFGIHAVDVKYQHQNHLQQFVIFTGKLFNIAPSDAQNRLINPVVLALALYCLGIAAFFISRQKKVLWVTPLLLFSLGNIYYVCLLLFKIIKDLNPEQIQSIFHGIGYDTPFHFGFYLHFCFCQYVPYYFL